MVSKIIADVKHPGEQLGNTLPLYVYFIVRTQYKVPLFMKTSTVWRVTSNLVVSLNFFLACSKTKCPYGFYYTLPRRQARVLIMEMKVPITLLCP